MSKVRVSPAATRRQNVRIAAAVAATALGSGFFGGGIAKADLVLDWKGDNYSSGNWVDSVSGTVATVQGSPTAVLNAFGTHTGVQTGNGGNFFTVAGGKAPGNLQNFTLAAVFHRALALHEEAHVLPEVQITVQQEARQAVAVVVLRAGAEVVVVVILVSVARLSADREVRIIAKRDVLDRIEEIRPRR